MASLEWTSLIQGYFFNNKGLSNTQTKQFLYFIDEGTLEMDRPTLNYFQTRKLFLI